MSFAEKLKGGTSLCVTRVLSREALQELKDNGIETAELSFNFDYFMNKINFPETAAMYGEIAKEVGVELYSLHLPFSRNLDISSTNKEFRSWALYTNMTLIKAAAAAGIKVIVLHPSSEPITDEDRPERMRLSREYIIKFREECDKYGMRLAVENLPRTCLCNTSDEMIELLDGTGAYVVFDTNHSLKETSVEYLHNLVDHGVKIISLHISDYDFVDERHRLPGDGVNDWKGILAELERGGYEGPLMHEVGYKPVERGITTVADIARSIAWLKSL